MIKKFLICPQQLRRIPKHFSWVDHRLVRNRHITKCSHQELALYLFLVTVGDAQGISYYSDSSIGKYLNMNVRTVREARDGLVGVGLIAYQDPLYQVLDLDKSNAIPLNIPNSAFRNRKYRSDDDDNDDEQPIIEPSPVNPLTPLLATNHDRNQRITPISDIISTIIERELP